MCYHLIKILILTQAQGEIDFPHGCQALVPELRPAGSLSSRLSCGKLAMAVVTPALNCAAKVLSEWKSLR